MARHGRCPWSGWLRLFLFGIRAYSIGCLGLVLVGHAHGASTEANGSIVKKHYVGIEHIHLDQLDAMIEVRVHKGNDVRLTVHGAGMYQPVTISEGYSAAGRKVLQLSSLPLTVPLHDGVHPHEAHLMIDLSVPVHTSLQATLIGLARLHAPDRIEGSLDLTLLGSSQASFFDIKARHTLLTVHGDGVVHAHSITGGRLEMGLHGSGNIEVERGYVQMLDVELVGDGHVFFGGEAYDSKLLASGTGAIEIGKLSGEAYWQTSEGPSRILIHSEHD